jgi:hypothetical protein
MDLALRHRTFSDFFNGPSCSAPAPPGGGYLAPAVASSGPLKPSGHVVDQDPVNIAAAPPDRIDDLPGNAEVELFLGLGFAGEVGDRNASWDATAR